MLVKNIISVILFTNTIFQHVNNMLNGTAVTNKFSLKIMKIIKLSIVKLNRFVRLVSK